ncbi:MAG: penicillin acylase family protein [Bacteroidales bacterium]|nr:penicillin acylase family protein [Bacteroidales bacterium]
MKSPGKVLFAGLLLITAALASGSGLPSENSGRSSPQYEGVIILSGMTDSITVYRDGRGMPHIYAGNEHDLYMAVGYISAQERLWQMDLVRRSSTGRLSEIFGKGFIQADIFTRCLQIREKSRLLLQNEDPEITASLQAFADGINAYINTPGIRLPMEFRLLSYKPEPWSLEDSAGIIGLMGWSLDSRNLSAELFIYQLIKMLGREMASSLIPDWDALGNVVYPEFTLNDSIISRTKSFISSFDRVLELGVTAFQGSNNWAVAGYRTITGKPILSNDIHLTLGSPGIWMQMHHIIPGKLNVTGVLIPGSPFIVVGHNEKIAWGMTNLRVDAVDLFAETINPENGNQYLFNGVWRDMKIREEIIAVRGEKQDTVMIRFTHRGPVISGLMNLKNTSPKIRWLGYDCITGLDEVDGMALSLRWSGFDVSDEIRSTWLLNRAACWDDFRNAVSSFRCISQNFIYADTEGNIGLNAGGGIPLRKGNGIMIRDGATDEYDWQGYVPFELMPSSFNPVSGQLSSANNRTVNSDYPYFISHSFDVPYRINRIREMLGEKELLSMDDLRSMVNDQQSGLAKLLVPHILNLTATTEEFTPSENQAIALLADWDYDMDPGLAAPAIFEYFRISFRKNLFADELADLYDQLYDVSGENYIYRLLTGGEETWVDNVMTEERESLDDIIMLSFRDCIQALTKKCGADTEKWKWGKIHTLTFTHPVGSVGIINLFCNLNSERYAVGGNEHTVSPYFSLKPGFEVSCGSSMRHIYNTADWDESLTVLPGGVSGVPGSEFYLSQAKRYVEGDFYKDVFSDSAVRAAARYTLVFIPSR